MAALPFPSLRRLAARLRADAGGVAIVEFAMSLPVVLTLGLGGLECANLALAHLRVSQIAMTVADNSGRVTTRIDESDINEVFSGALLLGQSINFTPHGRIVLSSLQDNGRTGSTAGQMINWQRCTGQLTTVAPAYGLQNKGRTDATLQGMGPTGRTIQSLPNTAVMFVEVSYRYQPLIRGVLPDMTIRYESAFNVRERTEQNITNAQSLPLNNC